MRNGTIMALIGAVLCAACTPVPRLYQWEGYQPQVYAYFKHEQGGVEAQVIALEKGLQKIRSSGKNPPPGYHAHLGMLYSQLGKDDQMVQQFQTEITLFPESKSYMEFLLKQAKR